MTSIQKSQNIADLYNQPAKQSINNNFLKNFFYNTNTDRKLRIYTLIQKILNTSSNILSTISMSTFLGSIASWYFDSPILGISRETLSNLSFKIFITQLGLIIPKYVVNYLGSDRLETIFKTHLPKEIDFQNSTFSLTDKKLKIFNNITNEKTVIKY